MTACSRYSRDASTANEFSFAYFSLSAQRKVCLKKIIHCEQIQIYFFVRKAKNQKHKRPQIHDTADDRCE